MKTLIPFFGILLNLNLFFAAAVTGQDIAEAIRAGDLAAIQGFMDAGVNFNQAFDHSTPLIYAIDSDRIEIARAILAAPGIDINYPSIYGVLPIVFAVLRGSHEIIRLLLANERCARNQVGIKGRAPLHVAATRGNTSSVQTLLEDPRVDRNLVSGSDMTALDYAIQNEYFDTAVLLINDPLVVKDRIDEKGMTILHKIAQKNEHDEFRRANQLRILDAILDLGVIDVNHQDRKGKTALHYAVQLGDPEMILRLTAAGANSAIEDESGRNAVDYARKKRALAPIILEALDSAYDSSFIGLK